MFGKLNNEEIDQLLKTQLVGRIGCHAAGITYIVPISYMYDGTHIYFHSFKGTKIDIMRTNPKVCFQTDNTHDLANWQSVICEGIFEELITEDERRNALIKLNSRALPVINSQTMRLGQEWPFSGNKDDTNEGIFFRIKLLSKAGRFEKAEDGYFFAT